MSIEQGRFGGMGGHQSSAMEKDEWLTPPFILDALGAPAAFDLDPCASVTRKWDVAKQHYTIHDNGLMKPWRGFVFMNSPYGGPDVVGPWMRRLVGHGDGIALIFARTETELFFETVWRAADACLFLEGRLFFHVSVDTEFKRKNKPSIFVKAFDRAPANGGAPSVLVAYGRRAYGILEQCGLSGAFVPLKRV